MTSSYQVGNTAPPQTGGVASSNPRATRSDCTQVGGLESSWFLLVGFFGVTMANGTRDHGRRIGWTEDPDFEHAQEP